MNSRYLDFNQLIAPLKITNFFNEYWEKQPYILSRDKPDYYSGLLSVKDIDFLVSSLSKPEDGWFSLIGSNSINSLESYLNEEQLLNMSEVYSAYEQGKTILLTRLHTRWQPIGELCRKSESDLDSYGLFLSARIGANLYLTPKNAQGFPAHYDNHDVLILQIEGTKHWRIYDPLVQFPTESKKAFAPRDSLGEPLHEIYVKPGDLLYIPRGYYHEALTLESHSLHLTLSIYSYTWSHLISSLVASDFRFRKSLPIGFLRDETIVSSSVEKFKEMINLLKDTDKNLQETTARFTEKFISKLDLIPEAGFDQLNHLVEIDLNTILRKRNNTIYHILKKNDFVQLQLPGVKLSGAACLEPVFRFLIDSDKFSTKSLPDILSDDEKITLVRQLVAKGFLKSIRS